jgi:hypothetical protein
MRENHFFSAISEKSPLQFIERMKENASEFGFRVHEVVNMKELYTAYGVEVAAGFEVYILTLCSPQKSYKSIAKNPERNAAIIEQKHIVVYKDKDGNTAINYLLLPKSFLEDIFPDDKEFPQSITDSCRKRIDIIQKSL